MDIAPYTPTEYLVMEVLAARYRLGESCWTFPSRVRPALRALQERGFLEWKSGSVERTSLVWLTQAGQEAWRLDRPYRPVTQHNHAPTRSN